MSLYSPISPAIVIKFILFLPGFIAIIFELLGSSLCESSDVVALLVKAYLKSDLVMSVLISEDPEDNIEPVLSFLRNTKAEFRQTNLTALRFLSCL